MPPPTAVGSCLAACIAILTLTVARAQVVRGDGPGGIGTTDGASELQLWFKADALGLADGAGVGLWNDASGSGNHGVQNIALLRPAFRANQRNGLPAVRFDQDFFDSVTLRSQAGNMTIVAVLSPDHLGVYHNIIDDDDSNAPMLWVDRQNEYELNFGPAGPTELSAQGPEGWDLLFAVTRSPGPSELHLNSAQPTGTAPGSLGNPASEAYDLFNRDGGQAFRGAVAELMIYDTALDSEEINAVGWYLQQKYALNLNFVPENPIFEGYETSPATYVTGMAVTPNNPVIIGPPAIGFTVEPSLPQGLNLNPTTGQISGTPQSVTSEIEYSVTASFPADDPFAAGLRITVVAQSALTGYATSPATYLRGVPIEPNAPEVMGSIPSGFSITPALPAGLGFDLSTGTITGTPTAVASSAEYTVTATFPAEPASTFDLLLEVVDEPATLRISEFMASNSATLNDGDGNSSDWVEVQNFGSEPVNLDGWHLTDRADNLNKWQFPSVVVPPGGYVLVFASNQSSNDYIDARGKIHTNFSLSAGGEYLALVRPDGVTVVHEYAPAFPPQLTDVSYGLATDGVTIGYFDQPTPKAANSALPSEAGPLISEVTDSPQPIPADGSNLTVTARVEALTHPVDTVTLRYRVGFASEVSVPMQDQGGGVYAAAIPHQRFDPGDMVRWKVVATDTAAQSRRAPPFLSASDSPEYFGTIIEDPAAASPMRKFSWFVQNPGAANTRSGTRSSVYFEGQFYDNVFTRVRGASSQSVAKKSYKFEFHTGHHFRFSPDIPRVDEINVNTTFQDKAYIRPHLTYESYADAGVVASDASTWRIEQNGDFFSVASFVEQVDSDLLDRKGLDPEGALYKMFNGVTSSTSGVEKKTRRDENNSDLQALVDGVRPSNPTRAEYLFDHIDIPAMINYATAGIISQDFDRWAKNFYVYRDTNGSGEWLQIPHDKDLTFGNRFYDDEISGDGFSFEGGIAPERRRAHPFQGAAQHACCSAPNLMIDTLVTDSRTREMYLRRLRTLMDEQLQPPGTPAEDLRFEARIDELAATMTRDTALDLREWGAIYGIVRDFPTAISLLKTNYLDERREYLYQTHAAAGQGGDGLGSTLVSGEPGVTTARYHVPGDDSLGLSWTPRTFVDDAWQAGPTGFGFEATPSTFDPLISTSVRPSLVHPDSTSTFLRIHFDVADPGTVDALRLRVKYDDGYVAYLNGTEIARRNVSGAAGTLLAFDHAATRRSDSLAVEFEEVDVGAFGGLVRQGDNVLAIQSVNSSSTNTDMLLLPELAEVPVPASPNSVGIPGPQPGAAPLTFGRIKFNPSSGSQADEYLEITNPNPYAVDVSGWIVEGAVEHTFKPGTVIPSSLGGGSLYLSPDVNAFRARSTSPKGNEERFVQGNYLGQLSARGETITIRDRNGTVVASTSYPGAPSDLQLYLRITELHYHPADPSAAEIAAGFDNDGFFEFIELENTGPTALDLSGAHFVAGVDFVFPLNSFLDPGERTLVVADQTAFSLRYSSVPLSRIAGEYTGRLDNDGELIQLHDAVGENILKFTYNDRWFPATDDPGYALVILDDSVAWDEWDLATSWGIGSPIHGSPGDPNGATVLQQFEGWLNSHFSPAEIDDPALSAPGADPDLDGRSNFHEYVFGTNPRLFDVPSRLPAVERVGAYLHLTYRFRNPALDLAIALESSADLGNWAPFDPELVSSSQDGPTLTVVRRFLLPNDPAAQPFFVRVRATKVPLQP